MWIIPKTYQLYLVSVRGTVELSELSEQLESSLMWRSKPSQSRTWLTRWKRGGWFQRLCGRILKPSLHTYFETMLTFLLEDIRVNRLVLQEIDLGKTTQDTCGRISKNTSESYDRECVSLKTSKDTFRWDSQQSSVIWKAWVTQCRGEYSQRLKSAHLIREKECLSWPTPKARDVKGGYIGGRIRNGKVSMDTLDVGVRAYTKGGLLDQGKNNTNGKNQGPSKNWGTPDCSDRRSKNSKLNPSWVESLQGIPTNWTQLHGVTDPHENRIDRLRLLGNGVVPQTAQKAFITLITEKINEY